MEKYGKETKTLLEIFAQVPVVHPTGFCLTRSKYHLTIKKPCVYTFLRSPDLGGLAARLQRNIL